MPYIVPEKRKQLDPTIKTLVRQLAELELDDPNNSMAGNLNYVFSKILSLVYSRDKYDDYNEQIGILECAKLELYRTRTAPYEDIKKDENGSLDGLV
jgi:hypothetical protein